MVPGGQSMSGPTGHSAYPAALITQPRLPGFDERIPDFLWIAKDSLHVYAVLIEIEAPTKRIFRQDGTQTADFTQAQSQLAEWKVWLSSPTNQQQFRDAYCPEAEFPWVHFKPQYVLIYGRRSEFVDHPERNLSRTHLQRDNEYHMTFDRLQPLRDHSQYMTVRYGRKGYSAVSMPPTFEFRPSMSESRAKILNKEDIVEQTPYLNASRKEFIMRRIPYWDSWSKLENKGVINAGDWE